MVDLIKMIGVLTLIQGSLLALVMVSLVVIDKFEAKRLNRVLGQLPKFKK